MRQHVPRSVLGLRGEPQTVFVDRFGGLPWGFSPEAWPAWGGCGRPQTHVAQFEDDGRLDLGAAARMLILFRVSRASSEESVKVVRQTE